MQTPLFILNALKKQPLALLAKSHTYSCNPHPVMHAVCFLISLLGRLNLSALVKELHSIRYHTGPYNKGSNHRCLCVISHKFLLSLLLSCLPNRSMVACPLGMSAMIYALPLQIRSNHTPACVQFIVHRVCVCKLELR